MLKVSENIYEKKVADIKITRLSKIPYKPPTITLIASEVLLITKIHLNTNPYTNFISKAGGERCILKCRFYYSLGIAKLTDQEIMTIERVVYYSFQEEEAHHVV